MTTNNDTPQITSEDSRDEWAGWADRIEPVAPHDDRPQPSFHPFESAHQANEGYVPSQGYPAEPAEQEHQPDGAFQPEAEPGRDGGYDPGSAYASSFDYLDNPAAAESSYPYATERGYPDVRYPAEADYTGEAAGPGYLPAPGPAAGAAPLPPMEPLPDAGLPDAGLAGAHGRGPAPALAPLPARTPPAAAEYADEGWVPADQAGAWSAEGWVSGDWASDGNPGEQWTGHDWGTEPGPAPEPAEVHETSESLTTESLLHGKRAAPGTGWRRNVFRATGGLLRLGESATEVRRRDLINRVRTPVAGGHHRVAVLSLKGGVGKTTTAVGLGATLATLRGDRVIAVDANPDRGTLSDKVRLETAATVRDLLNERDQIRRYADVRAFTSQASSRLEVLASDRDPGVSVAFGAEDYCDATRVLESFYSICITDCGTGLLHSAMAGVLQLADQIVLVSSPSVDGARSASATLDWLEAHGCGDLVRNGVVVLSAIRPKSKSMVDLDRLEHHFASRCRAVARIPYDPHLEEGAEVELELLHGSTADAYLSLAAIVGDGLAWPRRLTARSALP